jgi:hypothetical protein
MTKEVVMKSENNKDLTIGIGTAVAQAQNVGEQIVLVSGNTIEQSDAMLLGSMFMSGYFKDIDSLSKAVVRAAFGKRLGIDVMTAVTSLYIIDGKPALEAQAIRNTCVMAGYDIVTKKLNDEQCVLEWHFKGKLLGESKFTRTDALRMGFIDPTCKWPESHNIREIKRYNKWKQQWENKQGCECKDNWVKVPQDMLMARATTKGSRMYGNQALKQEVYDVDELRDSNIRPDTTPIDVARLNIEKAENIETLEEVTRNLTPEELPQLLDDISNKTKELLHASDSDFSASKK